MNEGVQERDAAAEPPSSSLRMLPRWVVIAKYILLAITAFLLTLLCPGTRLWISDMDVETLDLECFAELTTVLLLTLITLFMVQGSDPGYLNSEIMAKAFEEDEVCLIHNDEDGNPLTQEITRRTTMANNYVSDTSLTSDPRLHSLENVSAKGQADFFEGTRRKRCETCEFAPPLRAHHCRFCDKCVATFDHHCTFIGTCIGERNHCRFWWFLTAQLLGFLICSSIVGSSSLGFTSLFKDVSRDALLVVAAKLYLYPLAWAALFMWCGHTLFALANRTSFECAKGPAHIDYLRGTLDTDLPFSKGLDGNLRLFCCERDTCCLTVASTNEWTPIIWKAPGKIVRDSEDWFEHPWQNKYWSCC